MNKSKYSVMTIDSNGKTNAAEVILDSGFEDINPEADFYDENKIYKKDSKYYMFRG